ncbi:MAG: NAD-dependent epimerase/dehydratase family protein [Verrucomicrobiota bacterium]|nr:NAD-dependent epimerase/dehydratase family protein [Verrucomicrobiota bacterium]
MKILITGICGFVGNALAHALLDEVADLQLIGVDNLSRAGSHVNKAPLQRRGVKVIHADVRAASDVELIPAVEWIIDAAANPAVLAGVDGLTSSRQLIEHNLYGTVNLLELAKRFRAGVILLSTSRVYSIKPLAALPVLPSDDAFRLDDTPGLPPGISEAGIAEDFSTAPPVSLYGSSKLASEVLALEYGDTFGFPAWIDRCGILAGAGQFGRPDQGIFTFWINAYLRGKPLRYIGFGGTGHQTRDCLHPRDLAALLQTQMNASFAGQPRIVNVSGGASSAMSLAQLSRWCAERFAPRVVEADLQPRQFDLPWVVLDSGLATQTWNWRPRVEVEAILEEIAAHAEANEDWLEVSGSQ